MVYLQAIYPTVIIFIVAVNRSLIDSTLANRDAASGGPSRIRSDLLPSILFRNSSHTMHIPLSDVRNDWYAHRDYESGFQVEETPGPATGDHSLTA